MSIEAEAANIIWNTTVKATMKGAELALKITGESAKHLIALLAALMNNPDMKGMVNIKKMLGSPLPNTVVTIPEKHLDAFKKTAKQYGFPYAVIRDKTGRTGECDIMIRAEESATMQRVLEKMEYMHFKTAQVEKTITPIREKENPLAERPELGNPARPDFKIIQMEQTKGKETIFSRSGKSQEISGRNRNENPSFAGSRNTHERASLKGRIVELQGRESGRATDAKTQQRDALPKPKGGRGAR